jgi:hypothetical protein
MGCSEYPVLTFQSDEHYRRSPGCSFFALINQAKAEKKSARGKTARASKASRLSTQSVATVASEAPSTNETTLGHEDSVMTTASSMTQGSKKSMAKKATTSRAKKGKAKKEDASELMETTQQSVDQAVSPPPKPARGRKRTSDAIEDSVVDTSEAPAPKKRATRAPGNSQIEASTVVGSDDEDPAPKKTAGRKRAPTTSSARSVRKASFSSEVSASSQPSQKAPASPFPDDDEIERQLQADLDRQMSDDENFVVHDDSSLFRSGVAEDDAPKEKSGYAMFDPAPVEVSDADVDDELKALEAEMEMGEPEASVVSKKGRKAGSAGASKKTRGRPPKTSNPPPREDDSAIDIETQPAEPVEAEAEADVTMASTDTVIKKSTQTAKRGRGRPSKASLASQASQDAVELVESTEPAEPEPKPELEPEPAPAPVKRGRGRPSKASLASQASVEEEKPADAPVKRGRGRPPKQSLESRASVGKGRDSTAPAKFKSQDSVSEAEALRRGSRPKAVLETTVRSPTKEKTASPPPPSSSSRGLGQPPLTPAKIISPAPSARQAALSPSQSPQSSDAENQPPSSKPAASAKRVALAPVDSTPVRDSPSKRNVLAGLQSAVPWTSVDLDNVLGSPPQGTDKENGSERFLKQGKELTSPEKRMTVEEWIQHNAAQAEQQLRHECEMMISKFESEGTRAMSVLESLKVD